MLPSTTERVAVNTCGQVNAQIRRHTQMRPSMTVCRLSSHSRITTGGSTLGSRTLTNFSA